MKNPLSDPENKIDYQEKTREFRNELNLRYWEYQKKQLPACEHYFERPFSQDGRPPVFHVKEAWRNILIDPTASEEEKKHLLELIPKGEHHKWFRSMNSSQAFALTIFGNLVVFGYLMLLSELLDDDGLPLFGQAILSSENFFMEHKVDYLGERRRTSLDGYISGNYRIAIECKYTETEIGSCSRPRLTKTDSNFRSDYCDGTYSKQKERKERCSLTETGALYWKYISSLFNWNKDIDINPCPVNKNYQLVRNLLAVGVNEDGIVSTENGHSVLIYDERNPAFMQGGGGYNSYAFLRATLKRKEMLRKCSWQRMICFLKEKTILPTLMEQVYEKYGV